MNESEKKLVPQIILNDYKYLSVRQLYFSWFFNSGAEIANQILDNTIKIYLQSINKDDLIKKIRNWGGNESHNVIRIIELLIEEKLVDFKIDEYRDVLTNLYNIYKVRYLDALKEVGTCKTVLSDLDVIDYTYKYFRDRINISKEAFSETLINKLLLENKDIAWGEDKISLYKLYSRNNKLLNI